MLLQRSGNPAPELPCGVPRSPLYPAGVWPIRARVRPIRSRKRNTSCLPLYWGGDRKAAVSGSLCTRDPPLPNTVGSGRWEPRRPRHWEGDGARSGVRRWAASTSCSRYPTTTPCAGSCPDAPSSSSATSGSVSRGSSASSGSWACCWTTKPPSRPRPSCPPPRRRPWPTPLGASAWTSATGLLSGDVRTPYRDTAT